jgi:hypothetical protein
MRANPDMAQGDIEQFKEKFRQDFMKDNKKFILIPKDQLQNASLSLRINIAGKQKDLYLYTDKLVNIFRQIAAAPQLLDDPRMAKIFNQILESSGLSPIDFGSFKFGQLQQPQPQPVASTQPMQDLANNNQQI